MNLTRKRLRNLAVPTQTLDRVLFETDAALTDEHQNERRRLLAEFRDFMLEYGETNYLKLWDHFARAFEEYSAEKDGPSHAMTLVESVYEHRRKEQQHARHGSVATSTGHA